jgi:hypothetical protein
MNSQPVAVSDTTGGYLLPTPLVSLDAPESQEMYQNLPDAPPSPASNMKAPNATEQELYLPLSQQSHEEQPEYAVPPSVGGASAFDNDLYAPIEGTQTAPLPEVAMDGTSRGNEQAALVSANPVQEFYSVDDGDAEALSPHDAPGIDEDANHYDFGNIRSKQAAPPLPTSRPRIQQAAVPEEEDEKDTFSFTLGTLKPNRDGVSILAAAPALSVIQEDGPMGFGEEEAVELSPKNAPTKHEYVNDSVFDATAPSKHEYVNDSVFDDAAPLRPERKVDVLPPSRRSSVPQSYEHVEFQSGARRSSLAAAIKSRRDMMMPFHSNLDRVQCERLLLHSKQNSSETRLPCIMRERDDGSIAVSILLPSGHFLHHILNCLEDGMYTMNGDLTGLYDLKAALNYVIGMSTSQETYFISP